MARLLALSGAGGSASIPAPAAPSGVSAAGGTGQATVSWSAVALAVSYNVYYDTSPGVTPGTGTQVAGVTSPAVIPSLSAGTTYYFIVTAVNTTGEGAASAEVSALTIPAAPGSISAASGDTLVTVTFGASTGAASYNLYYSSTSPVTTASTKITGAVSPQAVTGLTNGTTYYFAVTAVDATGESVLSSEVSATPAAAAVIYSLVFNGSTAVIDVNGGGSPASFLDNPADLTVSCWVKSSSATLGPIVCKIDNFNSSQGWFVDGLASVAAYFQSPAAYIGKGTGSMADNAWHHGCLVKSGTTLTLYKDNAAVGTVDNFGAFVTCTNIQNVFIGADHAGHYYNGKLSLITIYTRALSAGEVATLYAKSYPADTTGLAAQYKFLAGAGNTLADSSGNGRTGSFAGATLPIWDADHP